VAPASLADIADITATIATDATYIDAGEVSATRPTLAVGDSVSFGAVKQSDGSYTVDMLQAHDTERVRGDQSTASEVAKPASSVGDAQIEAAKQLAIADCGATTG
jgi:hypothetical protein